MKLAIDIGLNLGWAFGEEEVLDHGVIKLPRPWGHDSAVRLCEILLGFKKKFGIKTVCVEHIGGAYYASNKALMAMIGLLQLVYADEAISYAYPTCVKKRWTGSGKAKKPDMLTATKKKYPGVTDHNESDAIAIFNYFKELK